MKITIEPQYEQAFSAKATQLQMTIEQLAQRVINTYCACLHKLNHSDMKKGYEDCAEIYEELSELI